MLRRGSFLLLVGASVSASCTRGVYDGSYDGGPSTTSAFGVGVTVGSEGAELSTPDGALALLVPPGALLAPVSIAIVPAGSGGARTTSLYRVTVTPKAALSRAATVTFDPRKAPNGATPLRDGVGLRLGTGADPTSPPTTSVLPVTGRPSQNELVFSGITFEIERVFGLIESTSRGRPASVPACVTGCCASVDSALAANGCGCATLGARELGCLQDQCDRAALASGCAP